MPGGSGRSRSRAPARWPAPPEALVQRSSHARVMVSCCAMIRARRCARPLLSFCQLAAAPAISLRHPEDRTQDAPPNGAPPPGKEEKSRAQRLAWHRRSGPRPALATSGHAASSGTMIPSCHDEGTRLSWHFDASPRRIDELHGAGPACQAGCGRGRPSSSGAAVTSGRLVPRSPRAGALALFRQGRLAGRPRRRSTRQETLFAGYRRYPQTMIGLQPGERIRASACEPAMAQADRDRV